MSDNIRVEFDPPRTCEEVGKAWRLSADGEDAKFMPKSQVTPIVDQEGNAIAMVMSRFIAENEGFVESTTDKTFQESAVNDADVMSRYDWYTLGITMAMVIRGSAAPDWEAHKLVRKLFTDDTARRLQ